MGSRGLLSNPVGACVGERSAGAGGQLTDDAASSRPGLPCGPQERSQDQQLLGQWWAPPTEPATGAHPSSIRGWAGGLLGLGDWVCGLCRKSYQQNSRSHEVSRETCSPTNTQRDRQGKETTQEP